MTLTTEKKREMVSKIMKLLALGEEEKNSNSHEREVAQQKAAQLMAEYAIDFVELRNGKPANDAFVRFDVSGSESTKVIWESCLAGAIGRAFDCRTINTDSQLGWKLAFCGTKSDVEIVVFFYKYLRRTVGKLSEKEKKKSSQKNYCYGMVQILSERLEDLYKKREDFIPSNCKDLVIVKKDGVEAFVKEQFPRLASSRRANLSGDMSAYYRGKEDGKRISLNRPISYQNNRMTQQLGR